MSEATYTDVESNKKNIPQFNIKKELGCRGAYRNNTHSTRKRKIQKKTTYNDGNAASASRCTRMAAVRERVPTARAQFPIQYTLVARDENGSTGSRAKLVVLFVRTRAVCEDRTRDLDEHIAERLDHDPSTTATSSVSPTARAKGGIVIERSG